MVFNYENNITKENDIGGIIREGLKNPVVRFFCTEGKDKSKEKVRDIRIEFCKFIGFCILFRNINDIEQYMLLHNRNEEIAFLKRKIAVELGISDETIDQRRDEIIKFAYENFKKNGYVFHAANSESVKSKMINGLKDNIASNEEKKELLYIESLYRKYDPNGLYSPLGHGATDILEDKTGWFFDGFPIHSMGYANSPQWFGYLCGKSYIYFNDIPEEKRNGYANRDYDTALEAVIWLVTNKKMSMEDAKSIIKFFNKCWNRYKDTVPCLMLIPVREVGINEDIEIEQYLSDEGMNLLFEDIILGKVDHGKNYCCKKSISSDNLSYVELTPILPKFKIRREKNNKNQCLKNESLPIKKEEHER